MTDSQHIIKSAPKDGDPIGQRGYMTYRMRYRGPIEEAARLFPHRVRRVADGVYAVSGYLETPLLGMQAGEEVEVWSPGEPSDD